jgi:hypothetical protein
MHTTKGVSDLHDELSNLHPAELVAPVLRLWVMLMQKVGLDSNKAYK